jgi:flagellum-specific peptidoglycan hydrolase FlgJ
MVGISIMTTLNQDNKINIKIIQRLAYQVYEGNQILADLTTAQAILESNLLGSKPSTLAFKYNNLFGIKGKGTKGSVMLETWEEEKGKEVRLKQPFAWNASIEDSLLQRKLLLENGTKNKPDRYHPVLKAKTFEEAARALVLGGYATDSKYATKLINIYEKYLKPVK